MARSQVTSGSEQASMGAPVASRTNQAGLVTVTVLARTATNSDIVQARQVNGVWTSSIHPGQDIAY